MKAVLTTPALGSRAIAALMGWRHGEVCGLIRHLHEQARIASPLWGRRYWDGDRRRGIEYLLGRHALRQFLREVDCGPAAQALRIWLSEVEAMQGRDTVQGSAAGSGSQTKNLPRNMGIPLLSVDDRLGAYGAARGHLTLRQVCRVFGVGETDFLRFLIEQQVLFRADGVLVPLPKHLKAGRMVLRSGIGASGREVHTQLSFTPKGVSWIAGLWRDQTRADAPAALRAVA